MPESSTGEKAAYCTQNWNTYSQFRKLNWIGLIHTCNIYGFCFGNKLSSQGTG